jgi:putative membrane protein
LTAERYPTALLALWVLALAVSAIGPYDRLTWFMEVAPVIVAIPLLVATRRRFPLTPLLYALIFAHGLILILGGHYTYARVPLGFWIQDAFDFARNHYDRIGHFAQGFIPAVLAREILLRRTALRPGHMLFYLVVSVALAFSAFYELIEWWAAVALDQDAEQFLATQGDVWDSQWDMFMAMLGAIVALVTLSGVHDGQLGSLNRPQD